MEDAFFRQEFDASMFPPAIRAKWSGSVLREGFVPFPKKLLRCLPRIFTGPQGVTELAVVLAVVDYKRAVLSRHPSLKYLAYIAGLTEEEFSKALESLKNRGLVNVESHEDRIKVSIDNLMAEVEKLTQE